MGERFPGGRTDRGSFHGGFQPQTGLPGPAASSPKASSPLPDKPSQEAAGLKGKEKEQRMEWAILARSPGLQLVPRGGPQTRRPAEGF